MFTGIVTDLGTILAVEERDATLRRLRIGTVYDPKTIALGASIACNGICLTAVGMGGEAGQGWFDVDYLGIDQGPILLQIQNHENALIWNVMKKNPYIVQGLKRAGFTGGWLEQAN